MPRALYLQDSLLTCRTRYTKANNLQSRHEKATFRSTRQTHRQARLLVLVVSPRAPCLTPQRLAPLGSKGCNTAASGLSRREILALCVAVGDDGGGNDNTPRSEKTYYVLQASPSRHVSGNVSRRQWDQAWVLPDFVGEETVGSFKGLYSRSPLIHPRSLGVNTGFSEPAARGPGCAVHPGGTGKEHRVPAAFKYVDGKIPAPGARGSGALCVRRSADLVGNTDVNI